MTSSLGEALARSQAVLASTLDPLITIDARGIIQDASKSTERLLGWSPRELLGQNVSVLMPEPYHSAHDGYLDRYRRTGVTTILGQPRDLVALHRDGRIVPIELAISRVDVPGMDEPLYTAIMHDLTARRQAEHESELLQTLALAIGGAVDLDAAMAITLRRIGEATGWSYGEAWLPDADGRRLLSTATWFSGDESLREFARMTCSLTFEQGQGLLGRVWAERRSAWVDDIGAQQFSRAGAARRAGLKSALAVPILIGEEVAAVIAFCMRDRIESDDRLIALVEAAVAPLGPLIQRRRIERELDLHRHHLEELVAKRSAELETTHEQLREADRLASIGTLAAGLGHDMNNVLLPVRCHLDALEAMALPGAAREHFAEVRKSADYLQHLADALHLLALDPEDLAASGESTELPQWWQEVASLLGRTLPRHVRLAVAWPDDLPPVVVPPHRLTQAVLNLLVNAGEAVGEGGKVRIWAEPCDDGAFVRLSVTDNGRGMPPEVKERALDPFFTTKKRGLGTGLGLSLVSGVATSAGGSVGIASALGRGTTVTLRLPAARPAPLRPGAPAGSALISIADRRIASLVAGLLGAAGIAVRYDGGGPDACALWVTDATQAAFEQAGPFLEHPGRQVVAVGPDAASWSELTDLVIDDPEDFDLLRQHIERAVTALSEP